MNPSTVATYVYLKGGEKEELPGGEYIRVVAQCMGSDGKVVRNDFALHTRGARFCRLLESLLDATDIEKSRVSNVTFPPVTIPQASKAGCECVLAYLDLIQSRVPTLLSKPLRAPLEELVQPWEMQFILKNCLGQPQNSEFKGTLSLMRSLCRRGPDSLGLLLEVAMISDFLLIEPLRDLSCAFVASLGLSANTEKELLQLCGLQEPLSEEDLAPLYAQYPFLRPTLADTP